MSEATSPTAEVTAPNSDRHVRFHRDAAQLRDAISRLREQVNAARRVHEQLRAEFRQLAACDAHSAGWFRR
jgi:hypothetical protein